MNATISNNWKDDNETDKIEVKEEMENKFQLPNLAHGTYDTFAIDTKQCKSIDFDWASRMRS